MHACIAIHTVSVCTLLVVGKIRQEIRPRGWGVFAYQAYHPCDKVYQVYQTRCLSKVAVPVAAEDKN